jgi:hypothetical protein
MMLGMGLTQKADLDTRDVGSVGKRAVYMLYHILAYRAVFAV